MPMKYARKWAWENAWLAWTVFALVVLHLAAALVTVPNLLIVYRSSLWSPIVSEVDMSTDVRSLNEFCWRSPESQPHSN
jgi:hypothetical protein